MQRNSWFSYSSPLPSSTWLHDFLPVAVERETTNRQIHHLLPLVGALGKEIGAMRLLACTSQAMLHHCLLFVLDGPPSHRHPYVDFRSFVVPQSQPSPILTVHSRNHFCPPWPIDFRPRHIKKFRGPQALKQLVHCAVVSVSTFPKIFLRFPFASRALFYFYLFIYLKHCSHSETKSSQVIFSVRETTVSSVSWSISCPIVTVAKEARGAVGSNQMTRLSLQTFFSGNFLA